MNKYFKFLFFLIVFSCQSPKAIDYPLYFPQNSKIDSVNKYGIELGRLVFFDKRLSRNDSISCATCHRPELAFTDGLMLSKGIYGKVTRHNSSTLFNIGFSHTFMFDSRAQDLEIQPLIPIHDSAEMNSSLEDILRKLNPEVNYNDLSQKAYSRSLDRYTLTKSLADYMRSLIAANSDYDDFIKDKSSKKFYIDQELGYKLFKGKGACNSCHTEPLFTNNIHYNLNIENSNNDVGLMGATHNTMDKACFKTPTLRNIELTSPYFHNGQSATLEDCLDFHLDSTRRTRDFNPPKLSHTERRLIIEFLKTLTEKSFKNSAYLLSTKK